MGSLHHPVFYDEKSVAVVEGVLRDGWESLAGTTADQRAGGELRTAVVNRLLDLLEQGITDPDELRVATLTHFNVQSGPSN